jgi:ferredoxin-nitrite reductase
MEEQAMNKFEQIKAAKDGLDVWPDIERYAREGWQAIADDDKARLKWYGLFFRKHTPGHFMLRIRIPNGIATTAQLRAIAGIATDFGRGELDLTTRQQVQVRWFRIEQVPEIFARLRAVGLDSRQTGMDNIRNVMGCPLAGRTPHELVDAAPVVRAFTARFVGDRAFSNLPRKFNVAITGCMDHCLPLESQDLALSPALKTLDGAAVAGFHVRVGGKMGSGGFTVARALDVFVRPEEAAELCAQVVLLFRDHGPRETRSRARLAFLLEDWGLERFRAVLEERLGYPLARAGRDVQSPHRTDHLGVAPQREQGTYSVGLAVPVGRLTAGQLLAVADLADAYGRGEVRLTPGQNLILPDIPDSRLRALLAEPLLAELRPDPPAALRGTVSCTGVGLCDLALTDTKVHALAVARRLERVLPHGRPLAIHWSGCPAGCGNHQLADIGLQGGRARVGDAVVEVYQVFVGGAAGVGARPAVPVLDKVPATRVGEVVEQLARAHAAGHDLVEAGRLLAAELGQAAPPADDASAA